MLNIKFIKYKANKIYRKVLGRYIEIKIKGRKQRNKVYQNQNLITMSFLKKIEFEVYI